MFHVTVSAECERALILEILDAVGVRGREAAVQADFLVEADLRGHVSHGVQRLPVIVGRLRHGLTVPDATVDVRWPAPAFCVVDGGRGLGPIVGLKAVKLARLRARETGIAVAAVGNSNHLGLLAPYVEAAAKRGTIAIALTTSEALVHPWGGAQAMLGTNPIAVGIPAKPAPFVLDMATGAIAMGKILAYRDAGRALEPGWAVDAAGVPTTDAALAAEGAISPFGGPKGYALGLAVELLVGILTASGLGRDVRGTLDTEWPCTKGDLFICIDPATVGIGDAIERTTAFLEVLRYSPAATEAGVVIPGDRARTSRERRLDVGIELSQTVWNRVVAMRDDLVGEPAA